MIPLKSSVDISTGILWRAILIVLALWFLYVVRDIIALLLIAFIVTAALDPVIEWCVRRSIPRQVGVAITYVIFFLGVGILFAFLVPAIGQQMRDIGENIPRYVEEITVSIHNIPLFQGVTTEKLFTGVSEYLSDVPGRIVSTTVGVVSGLIGVAAVIAMSFYMSIQRDGLKNFLTSITPAQHKIYVHSLIERIRSQLGRWVVGQLLAMIFVGALYFGVLSFLGVPYPLVLALIGGLLEIIPYIGPVIAAIISVAFSLSVSPLTGIFVAIAYIVINQIENHVLIPQIMKRTVGLNPLTIIIALLIGAKLAGVAGVILAVPITAVLNVFVKDILERKTA